MDVGKRLTELLLPLFKSCDAKMVPASSESIDRFRSRASEEGVPSVAIDELVSLYRVTDGVPCLDSFAFFSCDDEAIYEWWDRQELWLAQRDFYTFRWARGMFCLGDASNVSFSGKYEFMTLVELIEGAFRDWYPNGIGN